MTTRWSAFFQVRLDCCSHSPAPKLGNWAALSRRRMSARSSNVRGVGKLPRTPLMRISPRGYGPDIIEDHAGDGRRPHGVEQHSKEAATEGADEHRTIDLNCREHRSDVRKLDREAIIGGLGVVTRLAAAARIYCDYPPRLSRIPRQCPRELVKIRAVTG